MTPSYVDQNAQEQERLRALVERLSDEDLARPMPAGWTVAGVLAHLAFWDARAIYLMDRWATGIAPSGADEEPEDVDWINDSSKPLCLALPPRSAAELALALAADADRRAAALSDETVAANMAAGQPLNLSRANHRREHLDEIERCLTS